MEKNTQAVKDKIFEMIVDKIKVIFMDTDEFDWLMDDIYEEIADRVELHELYDDDKIINYVKDSFPPDDVFPISELDEWALNNGYTKTQG